MPFQHRVTARFHHVDRAGIVFFARAFEYAHDCFDEILIAAFDRPDFDVLGFGMPLVHADASYKAPIRLYDELIVSAEITRIGDRSVTYAYRVDGADGVHRCVVTLRHAFVAYPDFRGIPVPPLFVARMKALQLIADDPAP